MQVVYVIVLVVLVAFTAFSVAIGTWYGTWAGSGMKPGGRKFPGGPDADPPTRW
jgi:hypothetical protein